MVGAWWLLREAEAANLRAALVTVTPARVATATLCLPASKTDAAARGVFRSHACLCTGTPRPACPVHAAWDQRLILQHRFGGSYVQGQPPRDLPMFPDTAGKATTKKAFTETIRWAASFLRVPLTSRDGTQRVSGHSLRPTGAQGLARLGLDVWAIQLLGRWGSGAVMEYVRDSAASPEAAVARRALLGRNLDELADVRRHGASVEEMSQLALARVQAALPEFLKELRAELAKDLAPATASAGTAPSSASSSSSTSSSSEAPGLAEASAPAVTASSAGQAAAVAGDFEGVTTTAAVTQPDQVSSGWTSRRHLVTIGPDITADPAVWQTACGWRFGCSGGSREPRPSDLDCLRCFPGGF